MPRHFRTSARTTSPVPVPATVFVSRNISEPAPSTKPSPAIIQSQLPFTSPPPALSPDLSSTLGHSSPRTFSEPLSPLSLPPSSLAGDYDMEFESFPDLEETPYVGLLDVSVKSEIPAQDSSTGAALSEPIASPSPSERAISAANGASLSPVLQLAVDVGPEVEARSPETLPLHEADTNRVKRRGDHGREEAPRKKARFVPALAAPKLSDAKRTNDKSLLKGLPLEKKAKGEPKPRSVKQRRNRPRSPSRETFSDLDPELTGMLIESMATSRASSLPMSSLFKITMQSYPSFKSRGTEEQCLEMMERALEAGTLEAGGSGLFDKVERDPSDESESRHDSLWYYQPERDPDQDRAQLIKSMMPRPAKRAETKKHKQYYYRPLEKISKWDSEDAL
ncbi:unnamed protein product [Mycena citricolor]|uniref:Uncharacterized protein n=1 Tax=Mycena citricolor TaxID=2018698 RepID=A0AAD2HQD6_9AGAR|nr:unnamed protein product [Mycena citricolor]